jgi:protocatechuate 3,4-dioxygenase alpha subunit
VLMRGMLRHLYSRIYFHDEAANADDPVLSSVPPARRATRVATRGGDHPRAYAWDIVLQGDGETVFFDV